jgi:alpha-glucuronidase
VTHDPSSLVLPQPPDEDGYELWLRYRRLTDPARLAQVRATFAAIAVANPSPTLAAARGELVRGLQGLLGADIECVDASALANEPWPDGLLVAGTLASTPAIARLGVDEMLRSLGQDGFAIRRLVVDSRRVVTLVGNGDVGVLYGVFRLLRHLQTGQPLDQLDVTSAPRVGLRMLDHWDNLDGTIERGYAGFSLWDWHKLPDYVSPRMRDYARACASVGINAAALTNVNADARILTAEYLPKVAALADVFRPWGIRVFLTARFNAPMELARLPTADPLDPQVRAWWKKKADEIYRHVPDFGGFLVKANSEGQPGPQDFGPTHADGANMLADAVAPHDGVVIWRAFVYSVAAAQAGQDRAAQASLEFVPLDGKFHPNVLVQAKNGPIDFQPREPFNPLLGAMPQTPLMLEVQLTQEYLGFATHLAYLAPMFEETLAADTFAKGPGSTVARVVDGSLFGHSRSGMAAVANIGSDRNWCGHPFAQANWYAFGRLAWDPALGSEQIADEWLRMTFTSDEHFVAPAKRLLLESREAVVDTMTPLGLHHLMARDHHYGPGPWVSEGRPDWTSVYYHRADTTGLGFDRTQTGSGSVSLYASPLREQLADIRACPENLLLWFHHVPWDHRMRSGRTLWDELCHRYSAGVKWVQQARKTWDELAGFVDAARFEHVQALLAIQEKEARWWRNACLLYFQTFSRRPLPAGLPPLEGTLEEYQKVNPSRVPGI